MESMISAAARVIDSSFFCVGLSLVSRLISLSWCGMAASAALYGSRYFSLPDPR